MKTDMSPEAVTMRLKRTNELRRLCLALGQRDLKRKTETNRAFEDKPVPEPPPPEGKARH